MGILKAKWNLNNTVERRQAEILWKEKMRKNYIMT